MKYMFMPLRRYLDFQGRSRRLEFWMFLLLNVIVGIVFSVVFVALFLGKLIELARRYGGYSYDSLAGGDFAFGSSWSFYVPPNVLLQEIGPIGVALVVVIGLYSLLMLTPSLAVTIRRLHDTDRSGWWVAVPYGLYFLFALFSLLSITAGFLTFLWVALAMLTGLVAGVAGLVLLVFMLIGGTRGPNRFGPDPKGTDVGTTFA